MGVGGIGVSALALMAHEAGAKVSGCDRTDGDMLGVLREAGIPVHAGHDPSHAAECDLLVYSSAIPENHPERTAARHTEKRGAFLARFLNRREGWGVAGTHGKTTTSWLLASILIEAGMDPAVFVGGAVPQLAGRNYRSGSGPFVAELDESDGSFLLPSLGVAVTTNIESEHLSHYGREENLYDAFRRYAAGVAEAGLLIIGAEGEVCRDIYGRHPGRKLSFGIDVAADMRAFDVRYDTEGASFECVFRGGALGRFRIGLPGRHNILNALAAAAACLGMGVDVRAVRRGLAGAGGVERRMERLGKVGGAELYSDYAHHPTEVRAALSACRQRHGGKILVVFQPHLYSRTRDYADDFGRALGLADRVLLTDIYPAREEPIPGVMSALLVGGARESGAEVHGPVALELVIPAVRRLAPGFEAVVMMGAGNIDAVAREMAGMEQSERTRC